MKKKDLHNLRLLAAKIPPYYRETIIRVSGEDILKQTPNATQEDGSPIDPKGSYGAKVMVPTNHYRALKNAMKSGGIEAAQKYLHDMSTVVNNTKNGQAEILSGLDERQKAFSI